MKRKASILTNKQREYIQGERDEPPTNEPQFKGRIRERIEHGLFDFYLLFEYLEQEEVRKVFGSKFSPEIEPHKAAQGEIPQSSATPAYVEFAIAFFLRGLNYGDEDIIQGWEETTGEQQPAFNHFTEAVERGVRRYLQDEQGYVPGDVDVTIELNDIKDLSLIEYEEEQTE